MGAIGDTVQAGLMRVDSSPIQIAGAAQARANQALGQAVEKTAIGFFQGQAKKKKTQEAIQGLTSLFPDAPPELIKAMAKNPEVMQAKQQHDQLSQQMEIAKMRDATTRSEGGANRAQKAAIQEDAKNLREEQKAENNKFFNTLSGSVPTDQLTPEAIERIDRFNTKVGSDDPRRRAEVNDPQAFMERVKADPSSYVQKPVYELEGPEFYNQFKDPGMFQKAFAFQQKIQEAQPKAMTKQEQLDYNISLNKELRDQAAFDEKYKPMPPVDSKYDEATLTAVDDALSFLTDDTKKFFSTGVIGQALSNLAGTDATSLRSKLDTITSGVGFGRLSDMREASKTGGALGAISEIELRQLNASMGSLNPNQKPEELKKTLESIKKHYESTIRVLKAEKYAYDEGLTFKTPKEARDFVERYNNLNASSPQQTTNTIDPSAPAPQSLLDEIERKKQLRSKRAGL